MDRFLVISGIALAVIVVALQLPASAQACSCVMPDVARDLPNAEAAVVGTVVERSKGSSLDGDETTTLRLERVVRGPIRGPLLELVTPSADIGGNCGLNLSRGARVGLMLQRVGDGWHGSTCSTYDADQLLAADPDPDVGKPAPERTPIEALTGRVRSFLRLLCSVRLGRD
ncbi:MAG: hypothetical protein JWM25_26 [Thermoleophilia bacterium]|nr:hypothetical protein [Thermoleophilia bacterium]MCZ4495443.1 hypothetical protein [Thermoleophilia bacterium]